MGNWRFFCCPEGMIKVEELPEKWGLIYVNAGGKARVVHDCRTKKVKVECTNRVYYPEGFYWMKQQASENYFEVDHIAERRIFYTALRRLFIKGYVKHIYDKDYSSPDSNTVIQLNSETP